MHGAVAKRGKLISRHYLQGKETFRQKFLDYHRQAHNLLRDSNGNIDFVCLFLFSFCFFTLKLKDVELSPVVNRDLSRRVRPVAGAATAKQVIRDDIKLAAKLIRELDKKAALYEKESREETEAREKAEKEAAEVL